MTESLKPKTVEELKNLTTELCYQGKATSGAYVTVSSGGPESSIAIPVLECRSVGTNLLLIVRREDFDELIGRETNRANSPIRPVTAPSVTGSFKDPSSGSPKVR